MVSLQAHAIPIIADGDVSIVWAYPEMPPPSSGAPTLYDFVLDQVLRHRQHQKIMMMIALGGKPTLVGGNFDKEWPKLFNPQDSKCQDRSCHKRKIIKTKSRSRRLKEVGDSFHRLRPLSL